MKLVGEMCWGVTENLEVEMKGGYAYISFIMV